MSSSTCRMMTSSPPHRLTVMQRTRPYVTHRGARLMMSAALVIICVCWFTVILWMPKETRKTVTTRVSAMEYTEQWTVPEWPMPLHGELLPDQHLFQQKFDAAMKIVQKLLESERAPTLPKETPHVYDDKYLLAMSLTNTAAAAVLQTLSLLGVRGSNLTRLLRWSASGQSVTLRFDSTEQCEYLREETEEVKSDSKTVYSGVFGSSTTQAVTTVHRYYFRVGVHWRISAFPGMEVDSVHLLTERESEYELHRPVNQLPRPKQHIQPSRDVDVTWLMGILIPASSSPAVDSSVLVMQPSVQYNFTIDRLGTACRTPRRNPDVQAALTFVAQLYSWAHFVEAYFLQSVAPLEQADLTALELHDHEIFVPILPLFEKNKDSQQHSIKFSADENGPPVSDEASASPEPCAAGPPSQQVCGGSVLLSRRDVGALLAQHRRSLNQKLESQGKTHMPPSARRLLTSIEAQVILSVQHLRTLAQMYSDGLYSIEGLLRQQLVEAIGKQLSGYDFEQFMRLHQRRVFSEKFRPMPFVQSIRRPAHFPEGHVSIQARPPSGAGNGDEIDQPILTYVRHLTEEEIPTPMSMSLHAATSVTFEGPRSVHLYVPHSFAGESSSQLELQCRTRAFSSYLVVIGRLTSATTLDPQHAFILQNQDELLIPLLLEQMPSAGEFQEAISSLSPQQQRFAEAIRSMQLAGSLFGVLVVQLKPQLELLLNLPEDALTKEVALTEQLLELFIRYQIPSDLLKWEGEHNATKADKVVAVKQYAAAIKQLIAENEDASLNRAKKQAEFLESDTRRYPQPRQQMVQVQDQPESTTAFFEVQHEFPHRRAEPKKLAAEMPTLDRRRDVADDSIAKQTTGSAPSHSEPKLRGPEASSAQPVSNSDFDLESVTRGLDLTALPARLDAVLLARERSRFGTEAAAKWSGFIRPTTVKVQSHWRKRSIKSLLSKQFDTNEWQSEEQRLARQTAFDLLDALSRSGSLSLRWTELHVIVALTHQFDSSMIDTLVERNVNPIEKLEDAMATLVAAIHEQPTHNVLLPAARKRIDEREWEAGIRRDQKQSEPDSSAFAGKSASAPTMRDPLSVAVKLETPSRSNPLTEPPSAHKRHSGRGHTAAPKERD